MPRALQTRVVVWGVCAAIPLAVIASIWQPKEPVSGHKPLGYWFHELPLTKAGPSNTVFTMQTVTIFGLFGGTYGSQRVQPSASIAAVREMGTSALPFLMNKLSRRNLPFSQKIGHIALACSFKSTWFVNRDAERAQAVTGLLALPSLPESTIYHLNRLRRSSDPTIAASAAIVLGSQKDKTARQSIDQLP